MISTAGDAVLSVTDPSATAPGHLVNGTFVLPPALQARARNAANTGTAVYNAVSGSPLQPARAGPRRSATTRSRSSSVQPRIAAQRRAAHRDVLKTLTYTLSTTTSRRLDALGPPTRRPESSEFFPRPGRIDQFLPEADRRRARDSGPARRAMYRRGADLGPGRDHPWTAPSATMTEWSAVGVPGVGADAGARCAGAVASPSVTSSRAVSMAPRTSSRSERLFWRLSVIEGNMCSQGYGPRSDGNLRSERDDSERRSPDFAAQRGKLAAALQPILQGRSDRRPRAPRAPFALRFGAVRDDRAVARDHPAATSALLLPERDLAARRRGDDAAPARGALARLEEQRGAERRARAPSPRRSSGPRRTAAKRARPVSHSTMPPPRPPPRSSATYSPWPGVDPLRRASRTARRTDRRAPARSLVCSSRCTTGFGR